MSTFLSSMAVLLSTLALVCGGYAIYQVLTLQRTLDALNTKISSSAIAPSQINNTPAANTNQTSTPAPEVFSSPEVTAQSATTSSETIQPGQFVQPAFGKKAEVELLSVKRIKDPETGNRDVVNVQMRIRRLAADRVSPAEFIGVSNTTARNPETSETYKPISFDRSTGSVSIFSLRPNASADAYVWLRIPQGVNTLDIFVPDTAAFKNVPISN
ncbi:hypothetical protein [Fischerella sp. JS2]|uniref:hypothetical protein n=1 Tax=Fischerella sp. JS2 TaxID=2597771 RepID=UPI0037C16563